MIRPARPDDTPALTTLAAGTGLFKPFEVEVLRGLLDEYHDGSAGPDHVAVTLEREGRILGFAYFAPDVMTDRSWHLYWIAVEKDAQGGGVGSELLRHVEAEVKERSGRMMFIEVSSLPHSELTRRFYRKHGYEVTGVLRDFYSDGDDMVVFRKRLSRSGESGEGGRGEDAGKTCQEGLS
jgi:ribosomal protein S18 acetylase RimI-like enzyme